MFTTTSHASPVESARFGRHVAKVELIATLTDPGRPLGVLGAALGLAIAVNARLLGGSWLVTVLALGGSLIGWLALIWVLTRLAEARACRRAAGYWRYEAGSGAVALALCRVDPRTGGWLLESMAAQPRGVGAGSELMRLVCAQADDTDTVITLVAVTRRAAGWYARFGFKRVGRSFPLGQWRMERTPEGSTTSARRPGL